MSDSDLKPSKQINIFLLLFISFVIFNLGNIIDQTIRWSDHLHGFMNGIFHVLVFGVAWCIYMLPWSLVILGLYRWRKWKRFRSHWILAPSVLALVCFIGSLILHPPKPSTRFKSFSKTELPNDIKHLNYHFSGGGLADYTDTYYFETTPKEVDRIIADMHLVEDETYGRGDLSHTSVSRLPDSPDFSAWEGAKQYKGWDDRQHWFYYLITDSSRTKVYMLIGCI